MKTKDLKDRKKCEIKAEELEKFNQLIDGHRKLLEAIGKL